MQNLFGQCAIWKKQTQTEVPIHNFAEEWMLDTRNAQTNANIPGYIHAGGTDELKFASEYGHLTKESIDVVHGEVEGLVV